MKNSMIVIIAKANAKKVCNKTIERDKVVSYLVNNILEQIKIA